MNDGDFFNSSKNPSKYVSKYHFYYLFYDAYDVNMELETKQLK